MQINFDFSLQALNTFHVEAVAERYVRFDAEPEIVDFLASEPAGDPARLILGGGSNLLFVDDVGGAVLHPLLKGIAVVATDRRHVWVRAMAGEIWDDLVALAVDSGWGGLENLSLIPGSVGASVVQNIGAYGVEVESTVERVEAIDLATGDNAVLPAAACGFGYRTSRFKTEWMGRYLITAVVFRLSRRPIFVLDYPGVSAAVEALGAVDLSTVRRAVIDIRRSKLPDPAEIGNAGSFFKNPVVGRRKLATLLDRYPDLPHYPQGGDRHKLAAGWLIEHCGWKGRRLGRAAVHDRQALVLVNLGGATGEEILALSEKVRAAVEASFGIRLAREVRVIGERAGGRRRSRMPEHDERMRDA